MTTISLTDITVSSTDTSRSEGWLNVHLSNGHTMTAHCPIGQDNWAKGTQQLCNNAQEPGQKTIQLDKLLLQAAHEGQYIILKADLPRSAIPMTYARPANEHVFMELSHKQQSVFSADFLAIVAIIFAALYGLKWLFEKYVLNKF